MKESYRIAYKDMTQKSQSMLGHDDGWLQEKYPQEKEKKCYIIWQGFFKCGNLCWEALYKTLENVDRQW